MTTDDAAKDLQHLAREALERQQLINEKRNDSNDSSMVGAPQGNYGLHGVTEDKLEALISATSYL